MRLPCRSIVATWTIRGTRTTVGWRLLRWTRTTKAATASAASSCTPAMTQQACVGQTWTRACNCTPVTLTSCAKWPGIEKRTGEGSLVESALDNLCCFDPDQQATLSTTCTWIIAAAQRFALKQYTQALSCLFLCRWMLLTARTALPLLFLSWTALIYIYKVVRSLPIPAVQSNASVCLKVANRLTPFHWWKYSRKIHPRG